jgi:hypothetical protein
MLVPGLALAAYWFGPAFNPTIEGVVYFPGVMMFLSQHDTTRRLKAMQLRLASMHDRLDVLAGAEFEDHEKAEIFSE